MASGKVQNNCAQYYYIIIKTLSRHENTAEKRMTRLRYSYVFFTHPMDRLTASLCGNDTRLLHGLLYAGRNETLRGALSAGLCLRRFSLIAHILISQASFLLMYKHLLDMNT